MIRQLCGKMRRLPEMTSKELFMLENQIKSIKESHKIVKKFKKHYQKILDNLLSEHVDEDTYLSGSLNPFPSKPFPTSFFVLFDIERENQIQKYKKTVQFCDFYSKT
jgi:hypothetical protein